MFYYFFYPIEYRLISYSYNSFDGPKDLEVEVTLVSLFGAISFIPMTTTKKIYTSKFGIVWNDKDTGKEPPIKFQINLSVKALNKWKKEVGK